MGQTLPYPDRGKGRHLRWKANEAGKDHNASGTWHLYTVDSGNGDQLIDLIALKSDYPDREAISVRIHGTTLTTLNTKTGQLYDTLTKQPWGTE